MPLDFGRNAGKEGESSLVSFNKAQMQLWPGNEPFPTGGP